MTIYTFYQQQQSGDVATLSEWRSDYQSMDIESWHGKPAEECDPESWIEDGALKSITLESDDECSETNRVFPGWHGDAKDGEEYQSEWDCLARDEDGEEYRIIWQFTLVKGGEPEADCLDWESEENIYKIDSI